MLNVLIAAAALMATPEAASQQSSPGPTHDQPAPRTIVQWRHDVQDALRAQATEKDLKQPETVARLIALYRQLAQQPQLSAADQKQLRMRLRSRLLRVREQATTDIQLRLAKIESVKQQAKQENRPALLDEIKDDQAVLAQWNAVLPQQVNNIAAAGNPGALQDDGQKLVELIQTVISPDFWDINGGPGAIVYFPNLKCLVVSATSEVHGESGNLIDALRKAGN